ncbi:trafficking protein particle complex subunit 12-like [Chenopodium quinoa]|uniref:Trafficking protein particle complex subunit 12 n=1 Tax=Chenopodium quinoa TaxID=63459 RepID=A0A803KSM6_CHEQI|nr:trafficking protein particle complex subunit 12-like [Chenopodium quinoa]
METSNTQTTAVDGVADTKTSDNLITDEINSLHELALRGSWNTILEKVSAARSFSQLRYPHEHLVYLAFNAVALSKLRRYSDALDDIESSLENLDNSSYRYESYPNVYPNRTGSMIPFSLRWLQALLPSFLGRRPDSLDRLYLLLQFVRARIDEGCNGEVWRRRESFVLSTIISHHSNQKEFGVCFSLVKEMLKKDMGNLSLISKLGYVQLQFGDLEGAKLSFQKVEGLMKEKEENLSVEVRNLVGRNKALIYMVGKDYVSAVREYDECIERDGSDVVAINNKALCLMYLRDLSDSIKVLENSLERVPTVALNETLIVNLCSMYELAYVNHTDIKKTLSNWIARLAPDDFDPSCTRI